MRHLREFLISLGLLGFAFLCYASVLPTYFVSDDFWFIGRVARQGMFYSWCESTGGFLRPGTVLAYVTDYRVWGLNPIGYHLTNILFHGLAAYAVFLVTRHLCRTLQSPDPVRVPLLAACLFIALPCHSESVTWIAGRTDVMAVALGLGATACFLHSLNARAPFLAGLALVLFAAALLTKECVIVLPAVWCALFVHEWWAKKQRPSGYSVTLVGSSLLLLAGYFILRKELLGQFLGGYGTDKHLSIMHLSSLENIGRYVLRTFLPALPLRLYGAPVMAAAGFAAGVLVTALVLRWRQVLSARWALVALLGFCYLVSLIPVLTMHVGLFDTGGERFLYLPSAFACVLVARLIADETRWVSVRIIVLVGLIIAQAAALQWVNKRWITASQLCRQIAAEVARTDPATTVVLNVPDNYRGAYVFRNGLPEAATLFAGKPTNSPCRVVCVHDLNSMDESIEAGFKGSNLVLSLPDGLWLRDIFKTGFDVKNKGNSLSISGQLEAGTQVESLLSFTAGSRKPMLRAIRWEWESGRR